MSACPCGTGLAYADCCGPLHDGVRQAATAEALMRSRYSAFARGLDDYLFRTWHPRTRPDEVSAGSSVWTGLTIIETVAGSPDDQTGEVVFEARHRVGRGEQVMRERSRFARRAGRWFYLDEAPGTN